MGDATPSQMNVRQAQEMLSRLRQEGRAEEAHEFALAAIHQFPEHPYFYKDLWKYGNSPAESTKVAALAFELARAGKLVPVDMLVRGATVLRRSGAPSDLLLTNEALRDERVAASPKKEFFLAQIADSERRYRDAMEHMARHLQQYPDDKHASLHQGLIAYRSGHWGLYARAIKALQQSDHPLAIRALERVEGFFCAQGKTLEQIGEMPESAKIALSSPGAVFEHLVRTAPAADPGEQRSGLVMISGSLAAGGAERIVATSYQKIKQRRPEWNVELWLTADKMSGPDRLHYLPLTGSREEDIHFIGGPVELREPFKWLPDVIADKAQAIYDRLVQTRPRVVHASLDQANLPAAFAALLAGVPRIIMHCHNMRPPALHGNAAQSFGWDQAYRALLTREEVTLINVSQAGIDDYLDWINSDRKDRTRVIYNGFDLRQFEEPDEGQIRALRCELGIPSEAKIVGTALRFSEVKRPFLWLEAALRIRESIPDTHFVMYGDGELHDAVRAEVGRTGSEGFVHLPGRVSDLYRRFPLFDVFMLSSRSEGLPNVLIEAQASGVVPVTFDVGGCRETLEDRKTGLLVREESADALARAVCSALSEAEWRAAAAQSARQFVRRSFSAESMVDSLLTVMELPLPAGGLPATGSNSGIRQRDSSASTLGKAPFLTKLMRMVGLG